MPIRTLILPATGRGDIAHVGDLAGDSQRLRQSCHLNRAAATRTLGASRRSRR